MFRGLVCVLLVSPVFGLGVDDTEKRRSEEILRAVAAAATADYEGLQQMKFQKSRTSTQIKSAEKTKECVAKLIKAMKNEKAGLEATVGNMSGTIDQEGDIIDKERQELKKAIQEAIRAVYREINRRYKELKAHSQGMMAALEAEVKARVDTIDGQNTPEKLFQAIIEEAAVQLNAERYTHPGAKGAPTGLDPAVVQQHLAEMMLHKAVTNAYKRNTSLEKYSQDYVNMKNLLFFAGSSEGQLNVDETRKTTAYRDQDGPTGPCVDNDQAMKTAQQNACNTCFSLPDQLTQGFKNCQGEVADVDHVQRMCKDHGVRATAEGMCGQMCAKPGAGCSPDTCRKAADTAGELFKDKCENADAESLTQFCKILNLSPSEQGFKTCKKDVEDTDLILGVCRGELMPGVRGVRATAEVLCGKTGRSDCSKAADVAVDLFKNKCENADAESLDKFCMILNPSPTDDCKKEYGCDDPITGCTDRRIAPACGACLPASTCSGEVAAAAETIRRDCKVTCGTCGDPVILRPKSDPTPSDGLFVKMFQMKMTDLEKKNLQKLEKQFVEWTVAKSKFHNVSTKKSAVDAAVAMMTGKLEAIAAATKNIDVYSVELESLEDDEMRRIADIKEEFESLAADWLQLATYHCCDIVQGNTVECKDATDHLMQPINNVFPGALKAPDPARDCVRRLL